MKYTRYDIKKRQRGNLTVILVFVGLILVAYLLGTGLFKFMFKPTALTDKTVPPTVVSQNNSIDNTTSIKVEDVMVKFVYVQFGYFLNKDYAEVFKNKIKEQTTPYAIIDGDKTRIIAGIFSEKDALEKMKQLAEGGIENSKGIFEISKNNMCDAVIIEILNANIVILNKLMEKDVNGVQSDDFKKWVQALQTVDSKYKNYSVLLDIKKYMKVIICLFIMY